MSRSEHDKTEGRCPATGCPNNSRRVGKSPAYRPDQECMNKTEHCGPENTGAPAARRHRTRAGSESLQE